MMLALSRLGRRGRDIVGDKRTVAIAAAIEGALLASLFVEGNSLRMLCLVGTGIVAGVFIYLMLGYFERRMAENHLCTEALLSKQNMALVKAAQQQMGMIANLNDNLGTKMEAQSAAVVNIATQFNEYVKKMEMLWQLSKAQLDKISESIHIENEKNMLAVCEQMKVTGHSINEELIKESQLQIENFAKMADVLHKTIERESKGFVDTSMCLRTSIEKIEGLYQTIWQYDEKMRKEYGTANKELILFIRQQYDKQATAMEEWMENWKAGLQDVADDVHGIREDDFGEIIGSLQECAKKMCQTLERTEAGLEKQGTFLNEAVKKQPQLMEALHKELVAMQENYKEINNKDYKLMEAMLHG